MQIKQVIKQKTKTNERRKKRLISDIFTNATKKSTKLTKITNHLIALS